MRLEVGLRDLKKEGQIKNENSGVWDRELSRGLYSIAGQCRCLLVVYDNKCTGKIDHCSVLQQCSSTQRHLERMQMNNRGQCL